ncbi:MAG: hypothetical protein K0S38_58, partial [Candidatus Paceibacter sp.]|nr:hypothetical protein [Candidatus Paceibacter sp.]
MKRVTKQLVGVFMVVIIGLISVAPHYAEARGIDQVKAVSRFYAESTVGVVKQSASVFSSVADFLVFHFKSFKKSPAAVTTHALPKTSAQPQSEPHVVITENLPVPSPVVSPIETETRQNNQDAAETKKYFSVKTTPQVLAAFTEAQIQNPKLISEEQFVYSLFLLENRLTGNFGRNLSDSGPRSVAPNFAPEITSIQSGNFSNSLTITGTGTSTFVSGINLNSGCFAVNGTCISSGGGGSSAWGAITGTLSDQTDLQSALDAKLSLSDWYSTTTPIARGGTGLSTIPTYGQILVGNALGGYTLTATSSLGLSTSQWTTSGLNVYYSIGNVGIGTTSPYSMLSVAGQIVAKNYIATSTSATSTFAYDASISGRLKVQQVSTNAVIVGDTSGLARGSYAVDIQSSHSTSDLIASGSYSLAVGYDNLADQTSASAVGYANTASGMLSVAMGYQNTASNLNAIALGNSNLVSASGAIAVGTGITNNTANTLQIGPSDAAKLTILSSGNVGIGTTSPYAKLSVGGTIVGANFIGTTTATSTFAGGFSTNLLSVTSSTASSTFANGINLTTGCFAVNG